MNLQSLMISGQPLDTTHTEPFDIVENSDYIAPGKSAPAPRNRSS